jgi:hypothetical protein
LVRVKPVVCVVPEVVAVTVKEPAAALARNGAEIVATPLESVVSVSVFDELDVNVPVATPAAEVGAVNVTDTPLAGDPFDVTVTDSAVANGWLTCVLCGVVPLPAVIAITGALELLQPVRETTKVRKTKVRMLA